MLVETSPDLNKQKGLLLDDPRNNPRSHCPPSLTDVEALAVFDSDWVVYVAHHLDVVTWHDHFRLSVLGAFGPVDGGGFICRCTLAIVL